jgi:hypothetical protein
VQGTTGKFTLNGGEIRENTLGGSESAFGTAVAVNTGATFEFFGGEIKYNNADSTSTGVWKGDDAIFTGVYVRNSSIKLQGKPTLDGNGASIVLRGNSKISVLGALEKTVDYVYDNGPGTTVHTVYLPIAVIDFYGEDKNPSSIDATWRDKQIFGSSNPPVELFELGRFIHLGYEKSIGTDYFLDDDGILRKNAGTANIGIGGWENETANVIGSVVSSRGSGTTISRSARETLNATAGAGYVVTAWKVDGYALKDRAGATIVTDTIEVSAYKESLSSGNHRLELFVTKDGKSQSAGVVFTVTD